jgi:hypothetical protein
MKQHDPGKSLETNFALNNASHHCPLHRNAHYTALRYTHREIRYQTEENPGGDSHLDISVIPMLGHRLYTCEYRLGARAWQGFVDIISLYGWSH